MTLNFIELFPLIASFFVFFLGIVVFFEGKKTSLDFTFSLFALSISIWLFGTFMMFFNKEDVFSALFWDKFVYVGVVFIPSVMYHFGLALTKSKNIRKNSILISGYIISFIFLFLIPTDLFVDDVFIYQWGVHTKAQSLHNIFLAYFVIYLSLWFVLVGSYYRSKAISEEKKKIRLVFFGFFILASVGSLGFLPAYGIGIYPFAYISGVIFTIILAYTILKYRLFNIRIIATEFLVFAMIATLLIQVFFSETVPQLIFRTIFLLLITIFGFLLLRSVYKEVKTRERVEMLAKDLQKANEQLRELDKQKSEFVSIASHQLRTPLTAIKGYASLLIDGSYGKLTDRVRDPVSKIFESSQRLVGIVEDFLNVTRIEQGRMKYDFETIDLRKILQSVSDELSFVAKNKGIYIKFSADSNIECKASVDIVKIRQVIFNLIDNAIKYTREGGITTKISRDIKTNKILISISDTGIGISKDFEDELFKKFSRADTSNDFYANGSGIGLYIAREIVKGHNGKIWAESDGIGKGTTFFVELPGV